MQYVDAFENLSGTQVFLVYQALHLAKLNFDDFEKSLGEEEGGKVKLSIALGNDGEICVFTNPPTKGDLETIMSLIRNTLAGETQ